MSFSSQPKLRWADLHNHNGVSYGEGSLDRSYQIAEDTLDVYAFTVHGHWPDPPENDPEMASYHAEALEKAQRAFPGLVEEANRRYRPGKFVAFVAYEWHSSAWGDYVILFPGDSGELYRATDLVDLQNFVRRTGALMIPHHVGYRQGWRGLDWQAVDFNLAPLVEIFSEHGSSWEAQGTPAMLSHSMGGITASQTILRQLAAGRHFGFTAGTDTHFGYPGSYGEGITGIFADALTRESVFAALKNRHTLAATGDRIDLRVASNGALPGAIMPAHLPRQFEVEVEGLGPLDYIEVIKNGHRAELWPCASRMKAVRRGVYRLRLEWGWGRMSGNEDTDWVIRVQVKNGAIRRVIPCFGGGAGSTTKINSTRLLDAQTLEINSFSGRRNPLPINGVVLELEAEPDTRIDCVVQGAVDGVAGNCEVGATLAELAVDDVWGALVPRFTSPRIRLGHAWEIDALRFNGSYGDESPGPHDTYVFKARQTNGQMAWASPFLFRA